VSTLARTIFTPDTLAPTVPVNVVATAASQTSIAVSWSASSDAQSGVASYDVYRSATSGGTYSYLNTSLLTAYTDTTVSGTQTWFYKVLARDGAGNVSALSAFSSATTPDQTAPSTPGQPTAGTVTQTTIPMTWTASTDTGGSGLRGYDVERDGIVIAPNVATNAYTDTGLTAGTTYTYRVRARDNATNPNVSAYSPSRAIATTGASTAPVWSGSTALAFTVGVPFSLNFDTICSDPNGDTINYPFISGAWPSGIAQSGTRNELLSGTPTTVQSTTATVDAVDTPVVPAGEVADWVARSTGAGVVWSHNMDTANEVNQFRWISNYGSAPNAATAVAAGFPVANRITWNSSDGFAGGGCLEIQVPVGGNSDGGKWWRPFSALPANNNGKTTADLAASGTTQVRAWTPSNGTDVGFSYQKGYWGHANEQALTGTSYAGNTNVWDGTDFWVQCRVKISASRFNTSNPQGKLIYLDILGTSGEQEVLIRSNTKQSFNQNTGQFDAYTSFGNYLQSYLGQPQGDSGPTTSRQPGGQYAATCTFAPGTQSCWEWPADKWVTLLMHITPGRNAYRTSGYNGGDKATWTNAPKETGVEVYAAYPGDANNGTAYTKIWSKLDYIWQYDTSRNPAAFNAFIGSAYINAANAVQAYTQRYTQIILSKQYVPPPGIIGHIYQTDFAGTETILTEGGAWKNLNNGPGLWTTMGKAPVTIGGLVKGLCYGSNGANDTYDDSYAHLTGFGPDQEVEVIVYKSPSIGGGTENHEVSILLRCQDTAGQFKCYECLLNHLGGFDIVRWNGPTPGSAGQFTNLATTFTGGVTVNTGDRFRAKITGSAISVYYNDVLKGGATDSTLTTGQPGHGAFKRPLGSNNHFGITSFKATSTT